MLLYVIKFIILLFFVNLFSFRILKDNNKNTYIMYVQKFEFFFSFTIIRIYSAKKIKKKNSKINSLGGIRQLAAKEVSERVSMHSHRNENKIENFHSKSLKSAHGQRQYLEIFGKRNNKCPTSNLCRGGGQQASFGQCVLIFAIITFSLKIFQIGNHTK